MRARLCAAVLGSGVLFCCPDVRAGNPFGWHEHDGFYLRASTGLGPLQVVRTTKAGGTETSAFFVGDTSRIGGAAALVEISAGATPFDRFVVAGTVLLYDLPDAQVRMADDTTEPLGTTFNVFIVAPTVDIFPYESGGFHFGGGIGYADASATVQKAPGVIGGKGLGLTACAGYGFWVEDDWSLGGLIRGTMAFTAGHHASGDATGSETDVVSALSLAVTGLFH